MYQVPQLGGAGGTTVVRAHFGGSAWPLSHLGLDTDSAIYVGIVALAANLVVTGLVTLALRVLKVPDGVDGTRPDHYAADEGDSRVGHMTDLLDGEYAGETLSAGAGPRRRLD